MCGRYARWTAPEDIEELNDLHLRPTPLPITYNAAPQSMQPIVRLSPETGTPEIVMARWGLIPFWAKDQKIGISTFNARSEEMQSKPAFRESLRERRCLVPANCFYEWKKLGAKNRQPYAIGLKNKKPFAMAGLWDRWRGRDGTIIESFTISTIFPNELMKQLHDRMPVLLAKDDCVRWLELGDPEQPPTNLLRPYPSDQMLCWPVDSAVGNVRNDSPELVVEKAESSRTLF